MLVKHGTVSWMLLPFFLYCFGVVINTAPSCFPLCLPISSWCVNIWEVHITQLSVLRSTGYNFQRQPAWSRFFYYKLTKPRKRNQHLCEVFVHSIYFYIRQNHKRQNKCLGLCTIICPCTEVHGILYRDWKQNQCKFGVH